MVELIGQNELLDEINLLTIDNLPQSILFIGLVGCGKTTLINNLSEKFNLEIIELPKINTEVLNNIYNEVNQKIYMIDADSLSLSDQSELLKIIEEPPLGQYFMIKATSEHILLDTLLSRCHVYRFRRYEESVLESFIIGDSLSMLISKTPGDVLKFNGIDVKSIYELCRTMLLEGIDLYKSIDVTKTILESDFNLFLRLMLHSCFSRSGLINSEKLFNIIKLSADYIPLSLNNNLNKESLISKYLTEFIEVSNIEY